jgi:hypothetical protein
MAASSPTRSRAWATTLFASLVAFGTYSTMYAFRKPFTAAGFEGLQYWGVDYKVWLVCAQVIGYMLSKFYGIRIISEMKGNNRSRSIILLISLSWVALLGFALTPAPYNIFFFLLNGFPLGMVWGLVFSYIEGRRSTEIMGAVLATSFIFSSGFVKTIGKYTITHWQVTEQWMPFVTGSLFFVPMLVLVKLLDRIPPPTPEDQAQRSVRLPMNKSERKRFIRRYFPGLALVIVMYVLVTIVRDFRDNFVSEFWTEIGMGGQSNIFTQTEIPISIIVLCLMACLVLVRSNSKAFMLNHVIIGGGFLLAGVSTIMYQHHLIGPVWWMIWAGLGLYLSYIPFNCLFFERFIAAFRITGNVGFLMYMADSFGYLGSVSVLLLKSFLGFNISWNHFFQNAILLCASSGIILVTLSAFYFRHKASTVQNISYAA